MRDGYRYRGGIVVNYAKCNGCGKCYEICPCDVFEIERGSHLLLVSYAEECWYCGACIYDCPNEGAIHMELPIACL